MFRPDVTPNASLKIIPCKKSKINTKKLLVHKNNILDFYD